MTGETYTGTIPGLLSAAADRDHDGVWIRSDAGTLTFGAAAAAVGRTADALRDLGVHKGDLVMLTARTTPPYLLCWLALTAMGAIAVAVNPRSTATELAGLIGQVRPKVLVTDAELSEVVAAARDGRGHAGRGEQQPTPFPFEADVHGIVPAQWSEPAVMAGLARRVSLPDAGIGPDDVAVLIPTSGTTGRSKLVIQTHRAYAMAGEGFPFWMGLSVTDRLLTSLPLFHVNAPAYSVMGSLACGAGLVLAERFSASTFLETARRHGATEFNAIGAMLEILMRQPERPDDANTPLRLCYTGPAPERERQLEIEERFGLRIVVGYAMSESPYGLIWPHGARPYGTLGKVRQHPYLGVVNEARVIDDQGAVAGPGGTGELELRNPVITPGYWGMPEQTAAVMDDDWLRTGDLVTANEDGTYTFISRVKEVIRRRGENLSPLEVEEVLDSHPAVLESAVVGVPSELSEEEVKAFVVPVGSGSGSGSGADSGSDAGAGSGADSGGELDFAALRNFAAERLAAFKVPRYWQQVDELPRTPTARIAKHRLPTGHPPGEYDAETGSLDAEPTPRQASGASQHPIPSQPPRESRD